MLLRWLVQDFISILQLKAEGKTDSGTFDR
jgi:hypothetical protein